MLQQNTFYVYTQLVWYLKSEFAMFQNLILYSNHNANR